MELTESVRSLHECIHGPFGSGKTTMLIERLLDAEQVLVISPNKLLKSFFIFKGYRQEPKRQIVTIDSLIHNCTLHHKNLNPADIEGKRLAFVEDTAVPRFFERIVSHLIIAIDDADRVHARIRQRILNIATMIGAQVIATSRNALGSFGSFRSLTTSFRMPLTHEFFVRVLKDGTKLPATFLCIADPIQGPFLMPYLHNSAQTCVEVCMLNLEPGTVIMCSSETFGNMLRESLITRYPQLSVLKYTSRSTKPDTFFVEDVIICCNPEDFYGLEFENVVVVMDDLSMPLFRECITRTRNKLTIVFNSMSPPSLFSGVVHFIEPLIVRMMPCINWETALDQPEYKRPRSKKDNGYDTLQPRTITRLAEHIAREYVTTAGKGETPLGFLCRTRFSGIARAKILRVSQVQENLKFPVFAEDLKNIAGLISELIFQREICFIEPRTPVLLCPAVVDQYLMAIPCDDDEFLREWHERIYLHTQIHTERAWVRIFKQSPRWGAVENYTRIARRLGECNTLPQYQVFSRHLLQFTDYVRWAGSCYVNDNMLYVVPEKAWWILGALMDLFNNREKKEYALKLICEKEEYTEEFFKRIRDRLRMMLHRLGAQFYESQVKVTTSDNFTGYADFLLNGTTLIELKTCTKLTEPSWIIQAALYAHTLKRKEVHLLNVLNATHDVIEFDESMFY